MYEMGANIIVMVVMIIVLLVSFVAILSRYKRCPSDKIMVIYGHFGKDKEGNTMSTRCIHGGGAFVWPVFQSYTFLDLTPISSECTLTNALSKERVRVDVSFRFTAVISTEPKIMNNAAERLLGQQTSNIQNIVTDIILNQMRLIIANMDIEKLNYDREIFITNVSTKVKAELRKLGLELVNLNVTDIRCKY